jgi:chromate reductase, NAD(P)H dehydrogenase (quinone)
MPHGAATADGERHAVCSREYGARAAGSAHMVNPPLVLLISGSLRGNSTNTAALRTAQRVAGIGIVVERYDGVQRLPHFNPDDDVEPLHPAVAELRRQIHRADALVLSTPEYAGALPGSFKNVLDWTIGDDQPRSISEKPVAWINTSPRGASHAHESLRIVLGYANAAVVESACAHIPVTAADIGTDGLITDPIIRKEIAAALARLAEHVTTAPTAAI